MRKENRTAKAVAVNPETSSDHARTECLLVLRALDACQHQLLAVSAAIAALPLSGEDVVWDELPQTRRIKDLAHDLAGDEGIGGAIAQLEREVARVGA